jgi:RNA polymerase sigma-70 factor (ECF subfamily)
MTSSPRDHAPLVLVKGMRPGAPAQKKSGAQGPHAHEIDWSILMARAQAGDGEAYRRLLEEITPYLRALAARRHREPSDIEDTVQDVLLTLHAIRQTYDPARPFAPWLVAIANRRLVDRLRRQGRLRARETPLAPEHETFPADAANLENEMSDRRQLREALQSLPAGQRRAIQLLKLDEMSLKEASAATGISIVALKLATHRALKALRKLLSNGSRT